MPNDTTPIAVRSIWVTNPRNPEQIEQAITDELACLMRPARLVSVMLVRETPYIFGVSKSGGQFIIVFEATDAL